MEKFNYKKNFTCDQCGKKVYKIIKDKIPRKYCSKTCSQKASFGKKISEQKKIKKIISSYEKRVIKKEGCWEWKGYVDKTGYAILSSRYLKEQKAHRISYILHKGKIPQGLFVLHSCHNKSCTNPEHLRVGTNQENMDDKCKAFRQSFKISQEKINAIKIILKDEKFSIDDISKIFNIGENCINAIRKGNLD